MGRHRVPGTGRPAPDTGFWVRLGVAVVALVLIGGYAVTRLDGGTKATVGAPPSSASSTGTPPATQTPAPSASAAASDSPTPSGTATQQQSSAPSGRSPTLAFEVTRDAFITVRVPGGRTLVSRLFRKGATRSFDQKVLQVVNGRPSAVRFTVNGKERKPGPAGQVETFTVRRR